MWICPQRHCISIIFPVFSIFNLIRVANKKVTLNQSNATGFDILNGQFGGKFEATNGHYLIPEGVH
jgi:hypothetical protein